MTSPTESRPRVIGLTGTVGSGKSTVARLLAAAHVTVILADEVARELAQPGAPLQNALRHVVPDTTDRAAIAHRLFTEPAARARLQAVTDPVLTAALHARLAAVTTPYAVVEAANLFTLLPEAIDEWVEVTAPADVCRARALAAHRWPPATVDACLAWQQTLPQPALRHRLVNSGTTDALARAVAALAARLCPPPLP